jgi:hypothetical protein
VESGVIPIRVNRDGFLIALLRVREQISNDTTAALEGRWAVSKLQTEQLRWITTDANAPKPRRILRALKQKREVCEVGAMEQ